MSCQRSKSSSAGDGHGLQPPPQPRCGAFGVSGLTPPPAVDEAARTTRTGQSDQGLVEHAGDVALQTADDLPAAPSSRRSRRGTPDHPGRGRARRAPRRGESWPGVSTPSTTSTTATSTPTSPTTTPRVLGHAGHRCISSARTGQWSARHSRAGADGGAGRRHRSRCLPPRPRRRPVSRTPPARRARSASGRGRLTPTPPARGWRAGRGPSGTMLRPA